MESLVRRRVTPGEVRNPVPQKYGILYKSPPNHVRQTGDRQQARNNTGRCPADSFVVFYVLNRVLAEANASFTPISRQLWRNAEDVYSVHLSVLRRSRPHPSGVTTVWTKKLECVKSVFVRLGKNCFCPLGVLINELGGVPGAIQRLRIEG